MPQIQGVEITHEHRGMSVKYVPLKDHPKDARSGAITHVNDQLVFVHFASGILGVPPKYLTWDKASAK